LRASEAIAEWVTDCKRECAASGCTLRTLVISKENEEKTLGPLFFSSPPLSPAIFRYDEETKKDVWFLDVRLRFTKRLPANRFFMVIDTKGEKS
jgi:hypothetical protein